MSDAPATVFETFAASAIRYGARPFLHIPASAAGEYAAGPIDYTYDQALLEVERLRARYARAGYGHGHRVALLLDNRAETFLHFLALNAVGAGIVPVNSALPPAEMGYLLSHSDACLAVSLPKHAGAADAALAAAGIRLPVTGPALDPLPAPPSAPRDDDPDADSEAALLYTSGTTGKPKGCLLSNLYFTEMGRWYVELGGYCELRPGTERLITPLPLVHMNALACSTMGMITSGGCIVQLDRFHPSTWWQAVRESAATCLHYLGVMPAILLGLPESPEDDLSDRIRFGFGAGVDPKHHERFERRFGFPLIEGWAMTETGAGACIMAHREPRHVGTRCFGRPPAGLEYRIADDDGRDVEPGTPGELLVRRAPPEDPRRGFFSGYYKDPLATEEAWAGGWFHSGDIVREGPDGSLHFVDRKKNIIRRSGENIAAVEVEGALLQHPAVANCAVAPVADELRGEEVMALVVPRPGHVADAATAEAIFEHVLEVLVYYKAPGWLAFVPKLPTTPSQKVQRGEIKALARALVERGEAHDLRARKRRR